MKVGIVGAGSMGAAHALGWRTTDADLVGVFSPRRTPTQAFASQFELTAYDSVDELVDAVDVIDICVPTHHHSAVAMQAAAAGKHILCEKPLARTMEEGRAMVKACADNSVRMMVAHVLRFFPEYQQAHRTIVSGDYGSPAILRLYRHCFTPQSTDNNWFIHTRHSGGVILDLMLHDIDFALWSAGSVNRVYGAYATSATMHATHNIVQDANRAPVEDYNTEHSAIQTANNTTHAAADAAQTSNNKPQTADFCAGEHAIALLEHTNGALSHIEGSWAFPPPTFRMGMEIALERGLLHYDSLESTPLRFYSREENPPTHASAHSSSLFKRHNRTKGHIPQPTNSKPYATEIAAFYDALKNDTAFPISTEEALRSLDTALAILHSAQNNAMCTVGRTP